MLQIMSITTTLKRVECNRLLPWLPWLPPLPALLLVLAPVTVSSTVTPPLSLAAHINSTSCFRVAFAMTLV